jgi:hypothetical protein
MAGVKIIRSETFMAAAVAAIIAMLAVWAARRVHGVGHSMIILFFYLFCGMMSVSITVIVDIVPKNSLAFRLRQQ